MRWPRYALAIARKHAPEASVEPTKPRIPAATTAITAAATSLPLRWSLEPLSPFGVADNVISVEHTCTGRTTKMTTRSNVPAFRQTIFNATSRISPTPSGRRCGTSVTPIRSFQAWQRA